METFIKVKVASSQTESVSVKSGLRQGDFMSSVLVLVKIISAMNIGPQRSETSRFLIMLIGVRGRFSSYGRITEFTKITVRPSTKNGIKNGTTYKRTQNRVHGC